MSGFNWEEYEDQGAIESSVDEVIDDLNEGPEVVELDEDEDEDLDDVEQRLEVATHYKILLKGSLFTGTNSPAARIVEKRIRAFARTELRVLLGLEAPKEPVAQFTDAEVGVLKEVATKVLRTVEARSASPAVAAATPPTKKPDEPSVRARPAPAAPSLAKPKRTPTPTPPAPKKQKARASGERAPLVPAQSKQSGILAQYKTERDETVTTKLVAGRTVREYRDASGLLVSRNDLTPQVRPASALPMPSPSRMGEITHQQAVESSLATASGLGALAPFLTQGE